MCVCVYMFLCYLLAVAVRVNVRACESVWEKCTQVMYAYACASRYRCVCVCVT